MIRRETFIGAVLALSIAVPLAAQRPAVSPEAQQLRYQMQTFEAVLQAAVRHGGDAFARLQADSIPPGVQLTSDDPQVRGLAPPHGGGLLFSVSVPSIRITITELLVRGFGQQAPDPLQRVAGSARSEASAQGLAMADPMTASPVVNDGGCASRVKPSAGYPNPNYEYAVAVCDALMDAMLESSGSLPLREDEWLTVAAVNAEPGSYLNSSTGYTTYLSIKGADLVAYRQGRLSKEEARKLIDLTQR